MRRGWLLLAGIAFAVTTGAAQADVSVMVYPDTTCTQFGQLVTVSLFVDRAGSTFDGYEAVILYDTDLLQFVSVRQESLMLNLCGQSPWWRTDAQPGRIFISHVAMCGGLTLTGPGALSSITFRGRTTPALTPVAFEYVTFFCAGFVVPSASRDGAAFVRGDCPALGACCLHDGACALVRGTECAALGGDFLGYSEDCAPNPCPQPYVCCHAGECSLVLETDCAAQQGEWHPEWSGCEGDPCAAQGVADGALAPKFRLTVAPQPSRGSVSIAYESRAARPTRVEVLDAGGRVVRRLVDGTGEARPASVEWNGCDEAGRRVAPGTYFCRLSSGGEVRTLRVVRIE